MAIKDNRLLVDPADSTTGWTSIGSGSGAASAALDNDIFYQGSGSLSSNFRVDTRGWVYNIGAGTYAGNHFFFLLNCGVVGLLETKELGGIRARFGTSADANYIEIFLAGSDNYPSTFAGGWALFVVDIDYAFANYTNPLLGTSSGTAPSGPNAVTFVGLTSLCATNPSSNKVNSFIDAIYRLEPNTAGITIEGLNTGVDYKFADISSYGLNNNIPTFLNGPGGSFVSFVPLQFGNNTTLSTHGFSDTNKTLLFADLPESNTGFQKIDFVNISGSTLNVTAGVKTGTGSDATGAQGWSIQAADTANRWNLIANTSTANVNFYGCTFVHSNIIRAESSNTEVISTFLIDGNEYVQSTAAGSSLFLRNTVINANTADGEAYLKTVDIDNIDYSTFEFSDGHALEISSTSAASSNTFTSLENIFTGYTNVAGGTDTDAAIYNNSGQEITIQQSGGSLGLNSYRNGVSSTTIIENKVNVKIENVIEGSEVRMWDYSNSNTDIEISGGVESIANTDTLTTGSVTFNVDANLDVLVKVFKTDFNIERFVLNSGDGTTRRVDQTIDRVFSNP